MDLDRLAGSQFGIVSRRQLVERLKQSRSAIRWAVERGQLIPFLGPTFRIQGIKPEWNQRAMAATLVAGEDSALSHASAAALWGLPGFKTAGQIHVTTLGLQVKVMPEGVTHHHTKRSFGSEQRLGHTVTSLARTLVDVAPELSEQNLEVVLDAAQHGNPFLEQELDVEVERAPAQAVPGVGRIARLLDVRAGSATESPLETLVRIKLREAGLPAPRLQYDVMDGRRSVVRADFAWPEFRVVLHCDSFTSHSQRRQFELDATQRSRLAAMGWVSTIVTHRMLETETWLTHLRQTLQRRTSSGSPS